LSTSAERLEHAIVDATRLAFALSSFPQLPAAIAKLRQGSAIPDGRVAYLLSWVWQEQVGKALEDGIVTDAELETLVSAANTMAIGVAVSTTPAFAALNDAVARQARVANRPRRPRSRVTVSVEVPGGDFDIAAVGESHYQEALRAAVAGRDTPAGCDAALVPEDDNPYDAKAVRVEVRGECVGYLCRSHAAIYCRRYSDRSISCKGKLCGGDDDRPFIGIWLKVAL
jgi:hypothetical protein